MKVSADYRGEVEVEISFVAKTEAADYGVPGSPTWHEVVDDTVDIMSLEILGVEVRPTQLPEELLAALLELADGVVDWHGL